MFQGIQKEMIIAFKDKERKETKEKFIVENFPCFYTVSLSVYVQLVMSRIRPCGFFLFFLLSLTDRILFEESLAAYRGT